MKTILDCKRDDRSAAPFSSPWRNGCACVVTPRARRSHGASCRQRLASLHRPPYSLDLLPILLQHSSSPSLFPCHGSFSAPRWRGTPTVCVSLTARPQ